MTKEITLTRGLVALVDDEDFDWLSQWKWHLSGPTHNAYAARWVSEDGVRRQVWMHKLVAGSGQSQEADHRNHRRLDNRRENLRPCSHQQNSSSRRGWRKGLKGAYRRGHKWRSYIRTDGKTLTLGAFDTELDAARAYDAAARRLHGEFAVLNFPER